MKRRRILAIAMVFSIAVAMCTVMSTFLFHVEAKDTEVRILYAYDASYEAVAFALSGAKDGDVVRVPRGTADWSGKPSITIGKSISLQGCGSGLTDITNISLYVSAENVNIDGFTFRNPYIQVESTGANFRIHHNTFFDSSRVIDVKGAYGLIDHNTFEYETNTVELIHIYGADDSWLTKSTLGTAQAVYVEDNYFTTDEGYQRSQCTTGSYNARFVFRNNTVENCKVDTHGIWSCGDADHYGDWDHPQTHGTRHYEIYNNHFRSTNEKAYYFYMIELRGGTGIVFDNEFTGTTPRSSTGAPGVGLREYLLWNNTMNAVAPGKYYDPNYYPGHDMLGHGMNQELEPLYLWNNVNNGKYFDAVVADPSEEAIAQYGQPFTGQDIVKKNREYYEQTEGFDGTAGVGVGLVAERPSSCTAGVGYYATDERILYKAVSENTWEEYYTPYVYPHPLISESTEPPLDPNAMPSEEPLPWNAAAHFSGEQGANGWYYREWDGTAYTDMTYKSSNSTWTGVGGASLTSTSAHTSGTTDAVREWRASEKNTVDITGAIWKNDPAGDGVLATIKKNDEILWGPTLITASEAAKVEYNIQTEVNVGDSIFFILNRNKQRWHDSTAWSQTITIVKEIGGEAVFGDMNNDGKVNASDLSFVARNVGKTSDGTGWSAVKRADVKTDGKINLIDLVTVARKIP